MRRLVCGRQLWPVRLRSGGPVVIKNEAPLSLTIAMPLAPDTRASPARVFGLVVTRHLFVGAPAIFR